jgi:hypothetical protein
MVVFDIPLLYSGRESGTLGFATFVGLGSIACLSKTSLFFISFWRKHGTGFLPFSWLVVVSVLLVYCTLSCYRESFHVLKF